MKRKLQIKKMVVGSALALFSTKRLPYLGNLFGLI